MGTLTPEHKIRWFGNNTYHWWTTDLHWYKFEKFVNDNPVILDILIEQLEEYQEKTNKHACGFALLWNQLRWVIDTRGILDSEGHEYKLSNGYAAGYARLIMTKRTRFLDVFETRCHKDCNICTKSKKVQDARFEEEDNEDR